MEKYPNKNGMTNYFKDARIFYNEILKLCKKNTYNLVLHKHLGDVFYAIAAKPFFEAQYDAPLHFIIRPQQEFLMKMFGIESYSVYDLDALVKKNNDFKELYFKGNLHDKFADDRLENEMFQALFQCAPMKLGEPFICENLINNFFDYNDYWAYRWSANMGLNTNFQFLLPKNNIELSQSAKKKLNDIAPLDKIVLFAPEAATFQEFSPEFWNIIADTVHAHGYKIIVNSNKIKINHGISAFDLDLSLQDVIALGLNCAYVFSLRSGLCDVLVGAGKRLYAIYPAQGRREMYSLTKPFATNTDVNEIQIWNWKTDKFIWQDIDLTAKIQKYINKLHRKYILETILRLFSFGHTKRKHILKRDIARNLAGISKVFFDNNVKNPKPKKQTNFKPFYYKIVENFSWAIETKYYLLGGILTLKKNSMGVQRLRFLSIVLFSRKNEHGFRITRVLSIPIHKKDLKQELCEKIINSADNKYDSFYINRYNIGETYVYLMHIKNWIKKHNSKKPLIMVCKKSYIPLYKMFLGENIPMQYINISQNELNCALETDLAEYKGKKIICTTPNIMTNMMKTGMNFYDYICRDFDMTTSNKPIKPTLDSDVEEYIQKQIKTYFQRPFVVLMPGANSMKLLSQDFWQKIIQKLDALGYDIFINESNTYPQTDLRQFGKNVVSFDTDIMEIYALAKYSAGVISLATGIAVLLTSSDIKMDLIYNDFNIMTADAKTVQDVYSVYYLPNANKKLINEYDANSYNQDELINTIIKRYE